MRAAEASEHLTARGLKIATATLAKYVVTGGGPYIAIVDSMERAFAADLLRLDRRGTGYGALATVNSFGDLASSIVVGLLWSYVSIASGFWYAAVLTFAGAIALWITPLPSSSDDEGGREARARR